MSIDTKLYLLFDYVYKWHSNQKQNYHWMIPLKLFITIVEAEVVTNLGYFSAHFLQERVNIQTSSMGSFFHGWVSDVLDVSLVLFPTRIEHSTHFPGITLKRNWCPFSRMTPKRNWKMVPIFQGCHEGRTGWQCPFYRDDFQEELEAPAAHEEELRPKARAALTQDAAAIQSEFIKGNVPD